MNINFEGGKYSKSYHRKIADLSPVSIPYDVNTLYEATVFVADNNAMEVRSLYRSGTTKIKQVEEARNAFLISLPLLIVVFGINIYLMAIWGQDFGHTKER